MIVVDTDVVAYLFLDGEHSDPSERLLANGEYEVPSALVMQTVGTSECSAYDCEFVALAQYLGVPLATQDRLLLRNFPATARTIADCLHG